jgi:hypothetical protein
VPVVPSGVSIPVPFHPTVNNAAVLLSAVFYCIVIAIPGIAAALYAARRGVNDGTVLLGIGLATSGASAMCTFWAYFSVHALGVVLSFVVPTASLVVACWCGFTLGRRFAWNVLVFPMGLWLLGTLFLLCLGFLHGGVSHPLGMASVRFSHQLPSDSYLPRYWAEGMYKLGSFRVPPALGGWRSSDRPPLQTAYVLGVHPLGLLSSETRYQVVSVALQQTWIIGMWALLQAAGVRTVARGLVLVGALVSDVAIVHGFYVWPKLVAVSFLLAIAALVLTDRWTFTRSRIGMGALVGSLAALALLCHGTSIYAAVPLAVMAGIRKWPTRQFIAGLVAAGALLYVPWMAYRHFADPPGNRLEKWQLGGQVAIDTRSTLETIVDGYSDAGFGQTINNKLSNVSTITGGVRGVTDLTHAGDLALGGNLDKAIVVTRHVRFFSLIESFGLLLLAPITMVIMRFRSRPRGRAKAEWTLAMRCLTVVGIGCAMWTLAQFGNQASRTWIHVGSLAIPLLAITGFVVGLTAFSWRLAAVIVGLNALLVLALYTPSLNPPRGSSYSVSLAAFGIVVLGAFVVAAFGPFRESSQPAGRQLMRPSNRG